MSPSNLVYQIIYATKNQRKEKNKEGNENDALEQEFDTSVLNEDNVVNTQGATEVNRCRLYWMNQNRDWRR